MSNRRPDPDEDPRVDDPRLWVDPRGEDPREEADPREEGDPRLWADPDPEGSGQPVGGDSIEEGSGADGFAVFTINQVVAYNFMRARRASGWTQDECAIELTRVTGKNWTNASVSAAERSWKTGRIKEFNANEIMAFAQVFDKPIASFFVPIPDVGDVMDNRYVARRLKSDDPASDPREVFVPQDPGRGWLSGLRVLDYVLPKRRLMSILAEDVNRLAKKHGLVWQPGVSEFAYLDPEDEYWESRYIADDREEVRLGIADELIKHSEWRDPDPLRAHVRIEYEELRELIEESTEAAMLNFIKGLKRKNREVGSEENSPPVEDPPF